MKIAHIAPPWIRIPPKHYGGTETVIFNLIEEQVRQGHDVTLLAAGDARTSAEQVSFLPVSLLESGVPWPAHMKAFYHLQKSVEYVKEHQFDIVHTHLSSASDMYVFPLIKNVRLKTPVITTLHSRFPFDRVDSWTGDADDYFKEWFLSVPMVAISKRAMEDVSYPLNFIGVVHHGLPIDTFRPTAEQPEDYFVWLGRFMPEKGPHLAIQAAKQTGVSLVLAGIVDEHVPVSVRYFEEEIQPHLDNQHIRYIGPVGLEQKIDLFSHARGMLNPIQWEEPFGMVMIEAMAEGCPVVSFSRGAAPEVVADGRSGFLVNSMEEMVQRIAQVDELNRLAVRTHVVQNFSVRAMTRKYMELYEKLVRVPVANVGRAPGGKSKNEELVLPTKQALPAFPVVPAPVHSISVAARASLATKTSVPVQPLGRSSKREAE